ncbi:hypothetical protein OTU49_005007, partial [Cherax quadricarinatus]
GQHWKLIKELNECLQYACVCLEPEDCPKLITPEDTDLKPGENWILDDTGCCPRHTIKCTGECPEVVCPEFHVVTEESAKEEECCPKTKCEPPVDACIYDYQYYIDPSGFEQLMNSSEPSKKQVHKVGESWQDGFCLSCKCLEDSEGLSQHQCSQQVCPTLDAHPDYDEYTLESESVPNQCCSKITRTACIDDSDIIEVGETKTFPYNGCLSMECIRTAEGKVEKIQKISSCNESCSVGWEYEPPVNPEQCCGKCVQIACTVDDQVKAVGETWVSDDLCTIYNCSMDEHDQIQIVAVEIQCSEPSEEELHLYVFEKEIMPNQCCSIYTRVACLLNDTSILVGGRVQDPNDRCTTISCVAEANGVIVRHEEKTVCNTKCGVGSTYVEPLSVSNDCCGECLKIKCSDNETEYSIGEHWTYEDDACYTYSCEARNDVPTIFAAKQDCPYFDPECPDEEIYMDELGCCKLCSALPKRTCKPEAMPSQDTVGIFEVSQPNKGTCTNQYPVNSFMMCSGYCESFTKFQGQGKQAEHVSSCYCCKPSRFDKIKVELLCDSGDTYSAVYDNIAECECHICNDNFPEIKGIKQ